MINLKINLYYLVFLVSMTMIFLILIEGVSYYLSFDKEQYTFFVNIKLNNETKTNNLDLLTGWGYEPEDIEKSGFLVENEMVVLNNYFSGCSDTLKVLITGGSTSDLMLENDSWPLHFYNIFKSKKCCVQVRAAAVAGYHSGQEVLKLLRILRVFKPNLHISYSGGNEYQINDYVTDYEKEIFQSKHKQYVFSRPLKTT